MSWNKNYNIDHLKRISGIFKINEKDFTFGQFSRIKERDLVKYLESDSILYNDDSCIVWRELKRDSFRKDFRGEKIIFKKGDIIVDRFSSSGVYKAKKIFDEFLLLVKDKKIFVNIFEEDDITKEVLIASRFIWLSTKVMSSSELVGIYANRKEGSEMNLFNEERIIPEKERESLCHASRIMKINCEVHEEDISIIKKELNNYSDFVQHYSHYNKRKSWLAFALKGYDKHNPGFIIKPDEMSKKWKSENEHYLNNKAEYTSIAGLFPFTVKFAEKFGKLDRLRFMKLLSGGELSRHADITNKDAGVSSGKIVRLHLPIISHEKVKYYAWGLRGLKIERSFTGNYVFYLDQRKPHRVVNDSPIDRINLVMDVIL